MYNLFKFPTPTYFKITDLGTFIAGILRFIFLISGIILFIFLVWGGVDWMTSGGDSTKAQQARDKITYAIIGLAIVALAYALALILGGWLGLDFLKFNIPKGYS